MVRILVAPVGGRGCVRFLRSAPRPHFVSVGLGFSTPWWSGAVRGAGQKDSSIAIGLAGAIGAAVSDLTDVDPPARRIGLIHGLLKTR